MDGFLDISSCLDKLEVPHLDEADEDCDDHQSVDQRVVDIDDEHCDQVEVLLVDFTAAVSGYWRQLANKHLFNHHNFERQLAEHHFTTRCNKTDLQLNY